MQIEMYSHTHTHTHTSIKNEKKNKNTNITDVPNITDVDYCRSGGQEQCRFSLSFCCPSAKKKEREKKKRKEKKGTERK